MDITPIVEAVITLIGALISVFLIPWLKKNFNEKQRQEMLAWVKIGVAAAEQIFNEPSKGADKKAYVLKFLASKGYAIDDDAITNAIEAAVSNINGTPLSL